MSTEFPVFPRPGPNFDYQDESQFRSAVETAISRLAASISSDITVDLGDYYTSAQVDTLFTSYYTSAQVDTALAGKQDLDVLLTSISGLSDPGADRILGWYETGNQMGWYTPVTGIKLNALQISVDFSSAGLPTELAAAPENFDTLAIADGTTMKRIRVDRLLDNLSNLTAISSYAVDDSFIMVDLDGAGNTKLRKLQTQYLAITESQISDGSILARLAAAETVTGAWTFSADLTLSADLYLNDAVTYPTDSLLYRTATGQVQGTGASAQGDIPYNIDGSAWTHLAIGTEGQVLAVSATGLPEWVSSAGNASLLNSQPGSYYLNRANHTGTQAVTTLVAGPDDTALVTKSGTVQWAALTAADISPGTFQSGGAFTFPGDLNTQNFFQYLASNSTSGVVFPAYFSTDQLAGTTGSITALGVYGYGANLTATTVNRVIALEVGAGMYLDGASVGTISEVIGINLYGEMGTGTTGGVITDMKVLKVELSKGTTPGTITTGTGIYINNISANATTAWAIHVADGNVKFADHLYLTDATQYPTDSLLYVDSTGLVQGTGASATGDIIYNIDGSAWAPLAIGTEGQILKVSAGGLPEWAAFTATDASLLNSQPGSYYLSRSNHTGTQAVTTLTAGPDDTFLQVRSSTVQWGTLTAADIGPGTFQSGGSFTFNTQVDMLGDARISNGSNAMLKVVNTQVEIVATSNDTTIVGGWAREIEFNGGGAATAAAQFGVLGSAGTSITYAYISANATSEASDYNSSTNWRWYGGTAGIMYLGGAQPEIRLYENDGPVDEKYWRFYAAAGNFAFGHADDSVAGTAAFLTFYRNGNLIDYATWTVHDIRHSSADDNQYFRWYSNSTTGQTVLEMRRGSDSTMKWSIVAPSTGDFFLYNYNFNGSSQDTWIWGDGDTGDLFLDGNVVGLKSNTVLMAEVNTAGLELVTSQIYQDGYYDNGTQSAGGTLNPNWNNGNSQKCALGTGSLTINVDQASAMVGTSYTMQVLNSSGASRTVTWSGVDKWVGGSSPTASMGNGNMTVVQLFVAQDAVPARYIIGSVILDNETVPS